MNRPRHNPPAAPDQATPPDDRTIQIEQVAGFYRLSTHDSDGSELDRVWIDNIHPADLESLRDAINAILD